MKGLILAAGLGTRLRPITSLRPKPTIAVANRPLIHYAVDDLLDADVHDIGVVVSPDTEGALRHALASFEDRANFTYVRQDPPEGLAHAVMVARDFLADDPFVMYLSDNLFEHGIAPFVRAFDPAAGVNAVLALVRVADPRAFGVAEIQDGRIVRLVEKPSEPPSDLAVAGVYVFDASIHDALVDLPRGAKDEYQITDAIARLIDRGGEVVPVEVTGYWKDTGKPEDVLDANRLELSRLRRDVRGTVENAELIGEVVVEAGAVIRNATVVGPALIGAEALVQDAYVGPFTSLGAGVQIKDAEIEYAVVGPNSRIEGVATRIQASLIGEEVEIVVPARRPATHRMTIGDKSRLELAEG